VGAENALWLARQFSSLDKLIKASQAELEAVPGIGGVVASSIVEFFKQPKNIKLLSDLMRAGVKVISEVVTSSGKLSGQTIVLTGTLNTLTREQARQAIVNAGGHSSETISQKTNYVVAGIDPGSKYNKAKAWGIKILSEDEFLKLIN
jgi:DNA ligase (NAD+)